MDKKRYLAPLTRFVSPQWESSFLTSGSGEDAFPDAGEWDDDPFN